MKPMKAFPDRPDGKWGPPPCSITDPTWQLCQDDGWRALVELKKAGKIKDTGKDAGNESIWAVVK